ncbi:TerD family protein [Nocardia suismassiliense]|uniref:TerD family protein n=1 Tax=Nocardia suismassiliense TaxID=2077092 RepID=UPI001F1984C2|nr:TerD family protein [Nocardia suismassiliense]
MISTSTDDAYRIEEGLVTVAAPRLSKGQNLLLPQRVRRICVAIGWTDPQIDVDASALLLGSDGKVSSDRDFVFYNQPASPGGSVRSLGLRVTDDGARALIAIDLSTLPSTTHTVAVVGSVDSHRFGELGALTLTFVDENEDVLADYVMSDATTESALQFGEVYRRGDVWKVRAVGQGWASGLAGLATDFGVNIDGEVLPTAAETQEPPKSIRPIGSASRAVVEAAASDINSSTQEPAQPAMPSVELAQHDAGSPYRLWTQARTYCDYELTVEQQFLPALRSLYPPDFPEKDRELTPVVELIPEPDGPHGQWAISVRTDGRTIGYVGPEDAPRWAGVLRRIVASGFVPTTKSRIWAREYDGFDGIEFNAYVQIALGEPEHAIPLNDPPAVPYTMLPRSTIIQVTKEDEHFDAVRKFVSDKGYGLLFATLHDCAPSVGRAKHHVEVRVDYRRIGQLTPPMSQRFLPMVRHLRERGLVAACWADIAASAVSAKVRIDAIKANEASDEVLNGPPITISTLVPGLPDSLSYDLTVLRLKLEPLEPVRPVPPPPIPAEPSDGSLVRFDKGGGRYNYVAVRRGSRWETTATGEFGAINETMSWPQLASRVRRFDIATAWDSTDPHGDARVREHLAVIRFAISDTYIAAVNVRADGWENGDWYTTITEQAEEHLPLGDRAEWSEIVTAGQHIQVVTAWAPLH